ncbi:MAG: hypothetical protein K8R92_11420 [Planctomycetes bacterium]|nr:hypothetical protein [Planctomycetota bacterium]
MRGQFPNPFRIRTTPKPKCARQRWWIRAIPTTLLIAMLVVPLYIASSGPASRFRSLPTPILAMAIFAVAFTAIVSRRDLRLRVKAEQCGGRMCTACEYELTHAPDSGTCPECGTPYSIDEVVRAWTEWGFKPYDAANPAPAGIYWKLTVLIVSSVALFLAIVVPGLIAMVSARMDFLAARAAEDAATGDAKTKAMDATMAALSRRVEAATAFIPMPIWGASIVLAIWIAIALWHKWLGRRIVARGDL